jgi:hypothetical protein
MEGRRADNRAPPDRKRQKLARDQCANCFGFGHWRSDCPVNNTEVKRLSG